MAKQIQEQFTIHMPAGKATPAPPVGPLLGSKGVNIGQFIKDFNDKTRELMQKFGGMDIKVPVKVIVYKDRSYEMEVLPPITSHLILWKVKQKKGSGEPNKKKIGKLTRADLEEIAEIKKPVMNTEDVESIILSIAGTARNMGVDVEL